MYVFVRKGLGLSILNDWSTPVCFNREKSEVSNFGLFSKHGVSFHCYTDDTQIYLQLKHSDSSNTFYYLLAYMKDIKIWRSSSFLNLSEKKTKIIFFGPPCGIPTKYLGGHFVTSQTNTLGVLLDSEFKLDKQANSVVKSCFFHLRLLSKIKPFLSFQDFERVIHTFISSCLDYCNSLPLPCPSPVGSKCVTKTPNGNQGS